MLTGLFPRNFQKGIAGVQLDPELQIYPAVPRNWYRAFTILSRCRESADSLNVQSRILPEHV